MLDLFKILNIVKPIIYLFYLKKEEHNSLPIIPSIKMFAIFLYPSHCERSCLINHAKLHKTPL